ncbi:hypothetical protein Tco_0603764 [Tanacetum coccineum]
MVTTIADRIRGCLSKIIQSSSMSFITSQDVFLRQELLEYMCVHVNDASESSKPSWRKNVYIRDISATQSKSPTDKRSKKKKITSSFKLNTSTYVRHSKFKKKVTETQHAEEPVATANTTKGIDAYELAEEVMKEANSDLESLPDDEIMSISRDDDEEADSDRELYVADELVADNVIDEILTEINKEVTTKIVFAASNTKEKKNIPRVKPPYVQAFGAMRSYVPRLVFDALEQQLSDLLTTILKNNLPRIFTKSIRETLRRFNRRIGYVIKDEMHDVLKKSVLKPMYKELNALNKMESSRFSILEKRLIDTSAPYANVIVEGDNDFQSQPDNITDDTQIPEVPAPAQGSHKQQAY